MKTPKRLEFAAAIVALCGLGAAIARIIYDPAGPFALGSLLLFFRGAGICVSRLNRE